MKLSHKKVYDEIAKKYNLSYHKWKGNYTIFKDWTWIDILQLENIPATKKYMKTIYVMLSSTEEEYKNLPENIEKFYINQEKWDWVKWFIDYNTTKKWRIF